MTQIITNTTNGNQYRLLAKVGEGAYADVFRGENLVTKEIVAVKKMKTMKASDASMAQKQVQLMKCLKHKNIVQWIDDFKDRGIWYIVLEYCGKGDLQKYKEKVGRIPEYNCKALIRGILEALVELHSQKRIIIEINKKKIEVNKKKIAHRDLKLPNILINDKYQLKLADFGFSKDFEDGWMKSFCGTPLTMAPEVLKREKYNEKCDIWSLGVITYFLLYNDYPYLPTKSDGAGLIGLTNAVTNRIHKFNPSVQVSPVGQDFINMCLQKPLDKRPTAQELLYHPWWNSLAANLKWTDVRVEAIKRNFESSPEKEAQLKLKNLLFEVCQGHTKKLLEGLSLTEEQIKNNLIELQKYYKNNSKFFSYYLQLVIQRLAQLQEREIIITCQKKQLKFKLEQINKFRILHRDILKMIEDLHLAQPNVDKGVKIGEELILFVADETEMLLESFNQDEVNGKVELFKKIAKFVTADYDFTLINIEWGKREDLNEIFSHIFDMIQALTQQTLLATINEELGTDEDIQSIWTIQHHLSQNTSDLNPLEKELGKLVLNILKIPSNFNIDKTMQTELLQFKNIQFNDIDFLNFA